MATEFCKRLYIDISLQLHLKNAQISQEKKAFFWQNISFAHLQKGLHNEARGYWHIAEGYKKLISSPKDLVLFEARQAQIRGSLYRELDGNPDAGIAVLTDGLVQCEKIADTDLRYLSELNIRRDLSLCHLKKKEHATALFIVNEDLSIAQDIAGFELFCYPLSNYAALCTNFLAKEKESLAGPSEESAQLFKDAEEQFFAVNKSYCDYDKAYMARHHESMLTDCQDWASHVFHFGIFCYERGRYDEALIHFQEAKRVRVAFNLQGQLQNRVAEVCEWLAKTYFAKGDLGNARAQIDEALDIYQNRLQEPDLGGIERVKIIIKNFSAPTTRAADLVAAGIASSLRRSLIPTSDDESEEDLDATLTPAAHNNSL